jgi:hypothetical protein
MRCVNFKLYIFKWKYVLSALICEIYVMLLDHLKSEIYYGLCDVASVLALYRLGYVT